MTEAENLSTSALSHESLASRVAELTDQINALRRAYYEGNTVLVSDDRYDALMLELEAIERANPELITGDSPISWWRRQRGFRPGSASRAHDESRQRF